MNSNLEAILRPMSDRILVINPNSTEAVTRGIDAAMEPLRMNGGPAIECVTLKDGPPGIENQGHVEQVVPLIGAMVKQRDNDCSAFVIACYSDPGLHAARESRRAVLESQRAADQNRNRSRNRRNDVPGTIVWYVVFGRVFQPSIFGSEHGGRLQQL